MQNPSPFFVQVEPRPRYHRSASRFNVITLLQYSILMKTWAIIYISLEVITLKNIALVALLSRKVFFFCIKWSLLGIPYTWQFLIVDLRWAYLAKLLSKGRTTVHKCDVPLCRKPLSSLSIHNNARNPNGIRKQFKTDSGSCLPLF